MLQRDMRKCSGEVTPVSKPDPLPIQCSVIPVQPLIQLQVPEGLSGRKAKKEL